MNQNPISATRKTHLLILCGVLFLLPLIWTPLSKESFRIPKESIFESVLLFLFMGWFVHALYQGKARLRITLPLLLMGAFIGVNLIGLPLVRNMDYAYRDLFRLVGGVLLYFYLLSLIEEEAEVEWVGKVLIHGAVLMAILGMFQFHGWAGEDNRAMLGWRWVPDALRSLYAEDRPFSTSGNPIVASENVILVAPLALHYLLQARHWASKVFWFLIFNILWISNYTSGTKAAWIGFFIALSLYGLCYLIVKGKNLVASISSPYPWLVFTGSILLFFVVKSFAGREDALALTAWALCGITVLFCFLVAMPWAGTPVKIAGLLLIGVISPLFYNLGPQGHRPVIERIQTTTNVGTINLPSPSEIYPKWKAPAPPNAGFTEKVKHKVMDKFADVMATPSTQQRLMLWRITRMAAKDAPFFGVGPGNFCYYFTLKQGTFFEDPEHQHLVSLVQGLARQSHNEVLQILLENGVGGLLILSLAFLSVFVLAGISFLRTRNLLIAPLFCGLVATVVEGQFQFCFHVSPTTFLILGVAGLVDRLSLLNKPVVPAISIQLPKLSYFSLLLVPLLYPAFAFASFYFWKCELGSTWTRKGETALEYATGGADYYHKQAVQSLRTAIQKFQEVQQKKTTDPTGKSGEAEFKEMTNLVNQASQYFTERNRKLKEASNRDLEGLMIEPQNEELWFNLGLVYLRTASYLSPESEIGQGATLRSEPNFSKAFDAWEQGIYKEFTETTDRSDFYLKARAAYARTNQILDYGVARYNQAISMWESGEKTKAVDSLVRANFFDPFYDKTYSLLVEYLIQLDRLDEAEAWLKRARMAQPSPEALAAYQAAETKVQQKRAIPAPTPVPMTPQSQPPMVMPPMPIQASASQQLSKSPAQAPKGPADPHGGWPGLSN